MVYINLYRKYYRNFNKKQGLVLNIWKSDSNRAKLSHIKLYVNDFTICLGEKGIKAIKTLEEMAKWKKIV